MSITDVTTRIQQIQSGLAALSGQPSTPTSAAAFSSAMAQASLLSGAAPAELSAGTTGLPDATLGGTASVSGQAVVDDAKKYLGVPYVWGGTDPKTGLDCSGLVQVVYRDLGVDLPRVAADQAHVGTAVPDLAHAQPGDILAFGDPAHHVGIYVGDNQMIESPRPGLAVRIAPVYETPTAIRRVMTGAAATAPTPPDNGSPAALDSLFAQAGAKYGVDPSLLAAVAKQESGFDPSAVSPAGAQGLMQLMPSTAAGLGVSNPFDPTQAVNGAAKLLGSLQREFGSTPLALAAYNAGPGAVHRYGGIPPYPETQSYVRSVLAYQSQLAMREVA
ncbi:MAG: transglycosylase SLT domain-containing protein [Nocardioidaceae bacterium]